MTSIRPVTNFSFDRDSVSKASAPSHVRFKQPSGENDPGIKLYYHDGKTWRPVPGEGLKTGQTYNIRIYNGKDDIVAGFQLKWGPDLSRTISTKIRETVEVEPGIKNVNLYNATISLSVVKSPDGSMAVKMTSQKIPVLPLR